MVSFPPNVAEQILLCLSVPDRLRCREVSRAWRALLAQPQLWRVLDLSAAATGLTSDPEAPCGTLIPEARFVQLLAAASAAAKGTVQLLDLSGHCYDSSGSEGLELGEAVLACLEENGAFLRTFRAAGGARFAWPDGQGCHETDSKVLNAIAQAAPGLTEVALGVRCVHVEDCRFLLTAAGSVPAGAVHVHSLTVETPSRHYAPADALEMARIARDVAAANHPWLKVLEWFGDSVSDSDDIAQALADAVIRSKVPSVKIFESILRSRFLPHLTRALRDGSLLQLLISCVNEQDEDDMDILLNVSGAALSDFCTALSESRLESLILNGLEVDWVRPATFCAFLRALSGHPLDTARAGDFGGGFQQLRPCGFAVCGRGRCGARRSQQPGIAPALHHGRL